MDTTPAASGCHSSLWARGRLRHLEDSHATGRVSDSESLESRIVELSTSFGVLCRFTAVVAIDPREPEKKLAETPTRHIVQPVELPFGMRTYGLVSPCYSRHSFHDAFFGYMAPDVSAGSYQIAEPAEKFSYDKRIAHRILRNVRPKPGAIGDLEPSAVRKLLESVLALLKELRANGASTEIIERLATAYDQLSAVPSDQVSLIALLDLLADMAGLRGPGYRWWDPTPADTIPDGTSMDLCADEDISF